MGWRLIYGCESKRSAKGLRKSPAFYAASSSWLSTGSDSNAAAADIAHLDAPAEPVAAERMFQIVGDGLGEFDRRAGARKLVAAVVEEGLLFGRIVEEEACHGAPRVVGASLVRGLSYGCLKLTDKHGWIFIG